MYDKYGYERKQAAVRFSKAKAILAALLCVFILPGCSGYKQYSLEGGQPEAPVESDGGRAIVQGDWVYYLNGDNYLREENIRLHYYRGAICRMKRDGTERAVLCNDDVSVFNIKGDTIWYVAWENGKSVICSIGIDGSGRKKLRETDSIFSGGGYEFTQEYIYYVKDGCLKRMDHDGKNDVQLTKERVCNIIASGDYIYYTDYANEEYGQVFRIKHGQSEAETVTRLPGYVVGQSGGTVYYYLFSTGYCYAFDEQSASASSVAHLGYEEYCFAPETGYIFASYVSDTEGGGLYRLDLQSGTRKKLCDDRAERIAYYNGFLYYINDSALFSLYRIRIDGTDRECIRNEMISNLDALDIADDWLYYFSDDDEGRIYRINLTTLRAQCVEYEDIGTV